MTILKRFSKYLTAIEYPVEKTSWNIAGVLKGKNTFHKFDVRETIQREGMPSQTGRLDTKADKLVIETDKEWLVLDTDELNKIIKQKKKKILYLNDISNLLEWTIKLAKEPV